MAVAVSNTEITNTFEYWRNRTNELATAMSNVVLTVGTATTGNAQLIGTFTSNSFSAGLGSANVTVNTSIIKLSNSTSNISISIPNTVQVQAGNYYPGANSSWVLNPTVISSTTTSAPSVPIIIDSYSKSLFNCADYIINVQDNNANAFHTTRIVTMHDGDNVNAYITEYSVIISNSSLGVFNANANVSHVKLNYTPNISNANVRIIRTSV